MSDANQMMGPIIKGLSATVIAAGLDYVMFNEKNNTKHNIVFGISTGLGITIGSAIGAQVPGFIENTSMYNSKTISQRATEIVMGGVVSYGAFKYSGFDYNPEDALKRIGSVIIVDFISEYISDYVAGQPLQYLV